MYRPNKVLFELFHGQPIKIRWGAWVTDSYLLERDGWEFYATEEKTTDYGQFHQIHLAVTSPDKQMCLSGTMRIPYQELFNHFIDWGQPFEMRCYTSRDIVRTMPQAELNSWKKMSQIDIYAETSIRTDEFRFSELNIFKKHLDAPKQEIYIPEKNVDDLLNEILKIQYPEQQEIKKGLIMPERKPIVQAKILSLAA